MSTRVVSLLTLGISKRRPSIRWTSELTANVGWYSLTVGITKTHRASWSPDVYGSWLRWASTQSSPSIASRGNTWHGILEAVEKPQLRLRAMFDLPCRMSVEGRPAKA